MRHWQVQATTAGGGTFLFGVQAQDREEAQAKAVLVTGLVSQAASVTSMQVTEIPPRLERAASRT